MEETAQRNMSQRASMELQLQVWGMLLVQAYPTPGCGPTRKNKLVLL